MAGCPAFLQQAKVEWPAQINPATLALESEDTEVKKDNDTDYT